MTKEKKCFCCSGFLYSECCQLALELEKNAATPEALMRSRYSAYSQGMTDYIVTTTHPNQQHLCDPDAINHWATGVEWLKLQVVKSSENGNRGLVEFVATYKEDGEIKKHHELSVFQKLANRWYYSTGSTPQAPAAKLNRNDPCLCGSGKKYKKCCGRGK